MVEVEILGQVITHQYGTLNTGGVLRTNAEFAKHLVEDCGAAKYREASGEKSGDARAVEPETSAEASAHVPVPDPAAPAAPPAARGGRAKK